MRFQVREKTLDDRKWILPYMEGSWGSERIVTRNTLYDATVLPGLIAEQDHKPSGIALYNIEDGECEVVLLESLVENAGIGSLLLDSVRRIAEIRECRRLWLITTNDNTPAIRFYQKKGFSFVAVYRNAIEASRRLKPEIPLEGIDGIPLRDEVELELLLK